MAYGVEKACFYNSFELFSLETKTILIIIRVLDREGAIIIPIGIGKEYSFDELVEVTNYPGLIKSTESFSGLHEIVDMVVKTLTCNGMFCCSVVSHKVNAFFCHKSCI